LCNFKSAIVLKDKIYCPLHTDSHSEMIEDLKLDDSTQSPEFVKVEMCPPSYRLVVDQPSDMVPEWFPVS
jgi:hypothetical protein